MSEELKMLPIRQKQIVDLIKLKGFKQSEFDFRPADNESFTIIYKKTAAYFISIQNKKHSIQPALNGQLVAFGETANFKTALLHIEYWLKAVKQNVDVGNPWEEIENAKDQMNEMNFDSYEEVFNKEEQEKINKKLDQLLLEFGKLNIDNTVIKEDIKHLKTMSDKISKKDWILLLLGNVTGWVFGGILSPEHTQTIWESIKTLFFSLNPKLLAN